MTARNPVRGNILCLVLCLLQHLIASSAWSDGQVDGTLEFMATRETEQCLGLFVNSCRMTVDKLTRNYDKSLCLDCVVVVGIRSLHHCSSVAAPFMIHQQTLNINIFIAAEISRIWIKNDHCQRFDVQVQDFWQQTGLCNGFAGSAARRAEKYGKTVFLECCYSHGEHTQFENIDKLQQQKIGLQTAGLKEKIDKSSGLDIMYCILRYTEEEKNQERNP